MVIEKLATSLGRRDEVPNQELAKDIVKQNNKAAVKELIEILNHKKKDLQSDSIKVLYEIGELNPELISDYCNEIGKFLKSKNNRLVWGAMTALDSITRVNPEGIIKLLPDIIKAADEGSVITKDHGVSILAQLCAIKNGYTATAFPLLMEQLKKCPPKQLPMYSEKSMVAVNLDNKEQFLELLENRFPELEKDSQRKRVEKVMKKVK